MGIRVASSLSVPASNLHSALRNVLHVAGIQSTLRHMRFPTSFSFLKFSKEAHCANSAHSWLPLYILVNISTFVDLKAHPPHSCETWRLRLFYLSSEKDTFMVPPDSSPANLRAAPQHPILRLLVCSTSQGMGDSNFSSWSSVASLFLVLCSVIVLQCH